MNYSKAAEQSFSDMCALVTELAGRTIQQPTDDVTIYDGGFGEFNWYSRLCIDAGNAGQTEESAAAEQLLSIAAASRLPLLSFTEGNVPEAFVSGLSELGYKLEVTQTGMCVPLPLASGNPAASRTELGYDKSHTVKSTAGADPSIVRIGAEELAAWSDTVCRAFQKPDDKNAFRLMIHCDECHFFAWKENGEIIGTTLLYTKDGNAGIHEVGVLPEHRRRGIAAALVSHALHEAAASGAVISSLQASVLGEPMYKTLGYQEVSRIQTWINPRRIPALAENAPV